jgi:hypothetical protein
VPPVHVTTTGTRIHGTPVAASMAQLAWVIFVPGAFTWVTLLLPGASADSTLYMPCSVCHNGTVCSAANRRQTLAVVRHEGTQVGLNHAVVLRSEISGVFIQPALVNTRRSTAPTG